MLATVDNFDPELRKFVRESIEKTYKESTVEQIKAEISTTHKDNKPVIVHVTRNSVPVSYSYLSYKFNHVADFHVSKQGDHRRLYNVMDQPYVDYIIRLPTGLSVKDKQIISFRFGSENKAPKEQDHMSIFPLVKFLSIPELKRSSFAEYCLDYSTSELSESIKPSVCIIALKGSHNENFEDFMTLFKDEQKSLLPKYYQETADKNSDIFDAIKSIQFAYINLDANKKLKQFIKESVTVKNPRAMVFVSALNKVKFYNSADSLADDLEDIERGNYGTVRFYDFSSSTWLSLPSPRSQSTLSLFLRRPPFLEYFHLTQILVRSIMSWFTSIMMMVLAGVAIFGLNRFSNMQYHVAALIILGTFAAVGLFEGIAHSNTIGLL